MSVRQAFVLCLLLTCPLAAAAQEHATPLPLPKTIRVQSAGPREKVWESLSPNDKQLVIHLTNAANAGHALLFLQSHRYSLAVKHLLEEAFSSEHLADTKKLLGDKPFAELLLYAAKFFDQSGPYAPSNRKYVLREVTPDQMTQLAARHLAKADKATRSEIVRLLTDPKFEVLHSPENQARRRSRKHRRQPLSTRHHRQGSSPRFRQNVEADSEWPSRAFGRGPGMRSADNQKPRFGGRKSAQGGSRAGSGSAFLPDRSTKDPN